MTLEKDPKTKIPRLLPGSDLTNFPPSDRWDDWEEYDARAWPERVKNTYRLVPTTCFNCESACGLLAYIDHESGEIRKFEGNPAHPGSRGRNCAKGPATLNQVYDPERILHPLKRKGPRGSGEWEQVSWEEALDDIAGRLRKAISEERHDEIMYHVGRPGEDGYMDRVLKAWGVDGHNSHTNICSAGARTGYAMWMGHDRPSADFANARFILLLSSHLETGHYFNPHAQRIIEGKQAGAKLATIDPRLSNTASMSDVWLPTWPGTEPGLFLAIARELLARDAINRDFMRRWVDWKGALAHYRPDATDFEAFIDLLKEQYDEYTLDWAADECGVPIDRIVAVVDGIEDAGTRFASHTWRSAGSGNLGGWQAARTLWFLHVLTGSVGTKGGTSPSAWVKHKPEHWNTPPPHSRWNTLLWPPEYPFAHHELSFLLPYMLKEGRGKIDVYFSRVYNPIWTNPDGFSWLEVLTDEDMVGLHVALTPTWSETAQYADYVLPMGVGAERHDTHSYETHSGSWLGFRQPVTRVAAERDGRTVDRTYETNPEKSGRSPSSGSISRGRSTRTARWESRSGSSLPTTPRSRFRWTSTTDGCSRTRYLACRRRPRQKASPLWGSCASTARSRSNTTSTRFTNAACRAEAWTLTEKPRRASAPPRRSSNGSPRRCTTGDGAMPRYPTISRLTSTGVTWILRAPSGSCCRSSDYQR